jgi:ABC-type branched-subunit amino acid transport system substrate-binding protein
MGKAMKTKLSLALLAAGALFAAVPAHAQNCTVTIGALHELSGSNGPVVRPISQASLLAIEHINEAGGILNNCKVEVDVRDTQTQPTVAVDMGRQLVDVAGVGAILGPISSGLTLPLLTSVTVDKNVLLVSSASASPTFTQLGRDGATKGLFFRVQASAALEALAAAKVIAESGVKRIVIVNHNNDWGNNLAKDLADALPKLGIQVTEAVRFNADQPTYRSEVTKALEAKPEAGFMAMAKTDGLKIMREWVRLDGPEKFFFPLGVMDTEFITNVGPEVLKQSWFFTPGDFQSPSLDLFRDTFQKRYNATPLGPGREQGYDIAALLALAIHTAGTAKDGKQIAAAMYKVTDPKGERVGAGPAEFRKALAAIKSGKTVRYLGASGEIDFDKFGDVTTPFLGWQLEGGTPVKKRAISIEDVTAVKKVVDG